MLSKLKKTVPERDRIVIFEDGGMADIATVVDEDDQAIYAESSVTDYAIPHGDLKAYVGANGRIFSLHADADYVRDTQRLAALERSIVLRQITHFAKDMPQDDGGVKLRDILLYALIGVLVLAVIFK